MLRCNLISLKVFSAGALALIMALSLASVTQSRSVNDIEYSSTQEIADAATIESETSMVSLKLKQQAHLATAPIREHSAVCMDTELIDEGARYGTTETEMSVYSDGFEIEEYVDTYEVQG